MTAEVSQPAPDFELVNQFGENVRLSSFVGKSAVALVFYPLSFSGTCTGELCELRDNLKLFQDAKVELLAISVDSKFVQAKFAAAEGYEFQLLADFWPHGAVTKLYVAFIEEKGHGTRVTVLIDIEGNIQARFETSPGQARSLADYRKALEQL